MSLCPPPPRFSINTCTFIFPNDLALMNTLSSFLAKTNDASTSFIFNNSSAACAITIFILSVSVLVYAKHILLLMTFAF